MTFPLSDHISSPFSDAHIQHVQQNEGLPLPKLEISQCQSKNSIPRNQIKSSFTLMVNLFLEINNEQCDFYFVNQNHKALF